MTDIKDYENNSTTQLMKTSELLFESGLFPGAKSAAGIFAIVQYSCELGLSPVMGLQSISIVRGKLCMGAGAMLGLAKRNGVAMKVIEENDTKCVLDFSKGDEKYTSSFTIEEAEKAGLVKGGGAWDTYRKDMLYCRAVTRGIRRIDPGTVLGLYDPDEIRGIADSPETPKIPRITDELELRQESQDTPEDPSGELGRGSERVMEKTYADMVTEVFPEAELSSETDWGVPEENPIPRAGQISDQEAAVKALQNAQSGHPMSDAQRTKIHAIMTSSGFISMYPFFKMYLFKIGYINNADTFKSATSSTLASKIIDKFNFHMRNIFSVKEFHKSMIDTFSRTTKQGQVKLLLAVAGFVRDVISMPKKISEDLTAEQLKDYFELFLTTLLHQKDDSVEEMYKMVKTCKEATKLHKKKEPKGLDF